MIRLQRLRCPNSNPEWHVGPDPGTTPVGPSPASRVHAVSMVHHETTTGFESIGENITESSTVSTGCSSSIPSVVWRANRSISPGRIYMVAGTAGKYIQGSPACRLSCCVGVPWTRCGNIGKRSWYLTLTIMLMNRAELCSLSAGGAVYYAFEEGVGRCWRG